ncbi:MAG: transcriptional regulator NrdR [Candidatus Daviesbacteria bacterium]|nr:transcriptional regulator NrdR [Candidatus Daviesbacteria bacterium]
MHCPFCASVLSKVVDKRGVEGRGEIRRRRECLKCGRRFTTYEALASLEMMVIKKDGKRELFVADKLRLGLIKALEKRPGIEKTSQIVNKIEVRIRTRGLKEIQSQVLGRWVLAELRKIDQVAYLRFASVYRTFSGPGDFRKELEALS